MINSFIKTPKELLKYGQPINNELPIWEQIPKIINWKFGDFVIIKIEQFKTEQSEPDKGYRIWNRKTKKYYFNSQWFQDYKDANKNGWTLLDALSIIHKKRQHLLYRRITLESQRKFKLWNLIILNL